MFKPAAINWIAKLAAAALNFFIVVMLSRWLGPADRGTCALILVILSFILIASEFAGGGTLVFLTRHYRWRQLLWVAAGWAALASVSVCFVFLLLGKLPVDWLLPMAILGWLHAMATACQHLLLARFRVQAYAVLQVVAPALVLAGLVLLQGLDATRPATYLMVLVAVWGIMLLAGATLLNEYSEGAAPQQPWRAVVKSAFAKGSQNQTSHLLTMLNNRLLYLLFPAVALGLLANGLALAESLLLLPGALGQVYYGRFAGKADPGIQRQLVQRLLVVSAGALAFGGFALVALPEIWYIRLFGEGFAGLDQYLVWLVPGVWGYSVFLVLSYHFSAQGRFMLNSVCLAVAIGFQLLGLLILSQLGLLTLPHAIKVFSGSLAIAGGVALFLWHRQGRQTTSHQGYSQAG